MTTTSPDSCLECGRPTSADMPHGVCADCSMRNLLNASFQQTSDFGSLPLVDQPEKDMTIDQQGQAMMVDPFKPGEQISQFEVVCRLGRGGMGTVYEAQPLYGKATGLISKPCRREGQHLSLR